jgi:hypothetical protein
MENITIDDGLFVYNQDILTMETALLIIRRWGTVGVHVFGLFGNTVSFCITIRKENRKLNTCIYMTSLAVLDNLSLLSAMMWVLLIVHRFGNAVEDRNAFVK